MKASLSPRNTSGYTGVSWYPRDRKWRASFQRDGKFYHLGLFADIEKAHAVYKKAIRNFRRNHG